MSHSHLSNNGVEEVSLSEAAILDRGSFCRGVTLTGAIIAFKADL